MAQPCGACHGFTLLELLVVLVLIGIILGFAVLSVGDGGRAARLQQEAERLHAVCRLAAEEAVLRSLELGVAVGRRGYAFAAFDGEHWQAIEDDELFREHPLPEEMELTLIMDGLEVVLDAHPPQEGGSPAPQLLLFSSGERTPFELVLAYREGAGSAWRLDAPLLGRLQLQRMETGP